MNNSMTKTEVIATELKKWIRSPERQDMITGYKYYVGDHDILYEQRKVIGDNGELKPVYNLPDNRIVDNQYARIVDQKVNYSVGKQLTIISDDVDYKEKVLDILGDDFMRVLRVTTINATNCGIGWMYIYYNEKGELKFKAFKPFEVLPFWKDAEHTELDFVVRFYEDQVYEGKKEVNKSRVEIYTESGIYRYNLEEDELSGAVDLVVSDDLESFSPYMTRRISDEEIKQYSWGEIPLIPFKYNNLELPLINRGKSLQDSINRVLSNFVNNILEDPRNSILVIENYDGENLDEFRYNLAQYGAVKVRSGEGARGGVDVITVDVNPENYKAILKLLKRSLVENLRGVDAKDDKLADGEANQMQIQSMYNDIDLDASALEIEFQASLEKLMYFVNKHLMTSDKKVDFQFNRDILMNESEKIENFVKSFGRLSDKTAVANHPWVDNPDDEIEQMKVDNEDSIDGLLKSVDRTDYNDGKKEKRKIEEKEANRSKTNLRQEDVIK